jgi:hypothetical protein
VTCSSCTCSYYRCPDGTVRLVLLLAFSFIFQSHVYLTRSDPKHEAMRKSPSVIPNRQVQTHKLGPDTVRTMYAKALA